jgi:starch synthase
MFEPCGLAQADRAQVGMVPIASAVAGLADAVVDRDHGWAPREQRTGYVFYHADHQALESAMARGLGLWRDHPQDFAASCSTTCRVDRSWARPGRE